MANNNTEAFQAYPLDWPAAWKRTPTHERRGGQFKSYGNRLSVMDGLQRIFRELEFLGVSRNDIVISTNIPTRLDGLPRSDKGDGGDPGVAVYWRRGKTTQCMAIDRYDRVADNLGALSATLEAMRAIERHGGGEILDRAFSGFIALPAPEQPFQVLGLRATATRSEVERAWRELAAKHHPDRPGGNVATMARINAARDAMLERL